MVLPRRMLLLKVFSAAHVAETTSRAWPLATKELMPWHICQGFFPSEKPWDPQHLQLLLQRSTPLCDIPHIFYPYKQFQQYETLAFSNRVPERPRPPLAAMVPVCNQSPPWRPHKAVVLRNSPNLLQTLINSDEANKEQQDVKGANADYKLKGILFDN